MLRVRMLRVRMLRVRMLRTLQIVMSMRNVYS